MRCGKRDDLEPLDKFDRRRVNRNVNVRIEHLSRFVGQKPALMSGSNLSTILAMSSAISRTSTESIAFDS